MPQTPLPPLVLTTHATRRMGQRQVTLSDLHEAAAGASVFRQADGRLEVRGRNGTTYITVATGAVVVTVLPRHARRSPWTAPHSRLGAGLSRHRPARPAAQARRANP